MSRENNPFAPDENPFGDAAVVDAAEYNEDQSDEKHLREDDEVANEKSQSKKGFFGFSLGSQGKTNPFASSSPPPPPSYPSQYDHNGPTPPYSNQEPTYSNQDPSNRREDDLRRKEAELEARARALEEQRQQQDQNPNAPKLPNWPKFRPTIYHSIETEIPVEWQRTVRNLYYSWLFTILCLVMNMIGCLCILIAGVSGKDFGSSILYFVVITPASFFLWYRPVYNGFMKDSGFYFLLYLVFGGFHIAFELYLLLGINDTGGAGFINTILLFTSTSSSGKHYYGEAVFCLFGLIFWFVAVLVHIFLYRIVYRVYKSRGHTFQEARNHAMSSAAQSDVGRQAVSSAVSGAAQGMMSPNQGNQGNQGNQRGF